MEKNEVIGHMFTKAFSENGYDISLVHNTNEALFHLNTFQFDIIMIDITRFPDDGLEFMREAGILEFESEKVFLKADHGIDIRLEIMRSTTCEFGEIPFRCNEMGFLIEKVLQEYNAETSSLKVCSRCRRKCLHNDELSSPLM